MSLILHIRIVYAIVGEEPPTSDLLNEIVIPILLRKRSQHTPRVGVPIPERGLHYTSLIDDEL